MENKTYHPRNADLHLRSRGGSDHYFWIHNGYLYLNVDFQTVRALKSVNHSDVMRIANKLLDNEATVDRCSRTFRKVWTGTAWNDTSLPKVGDRR